MNSLMFEKTPDLPAMPKHRDSSRGLLLRVEESKEPRSSSAVVGGELFSPLYLPNCHGS
jgi:hypothetical protein